MSKRGPAKKTNTGDIRTSILGESERKKSLRSSKMAGSGETEGHDNDSDKSSSALAETLARIDSTLSQVKISILRL